MLRIDRGPGTLTVVTRFARPRALAILAGALAGAALVAARALPGAAAALAALALLVAVAGGRAVRAVFAGGRVRVSSPVPLGRGSDHSLLEFVAVRVETIAQARRRKAERHAAIHRDRSGAELPSWLVPADAPGVNDHLRRLVLEPRAGDPLPVTAWLAEEDLEPARAEVATLLG